MGAQDDLAADRQRKRPQGSINELFHLAAVVFVAYEYVGGSVDNHARRLKVEGLLPNPLVELRIFGLPVPIEYRQRVVLADADPVVQVAQGAHVASVKAANRVQPAMDLIFGIFAIDAKRWTRRHG